MKILLDGVELKLKSFEPPERTWEKAGVRISQYIDANGLLRNFIYPHGYSFEMERIVEKNTVPEIDWGSIHRSGSRLARHFRCFRFPFLSQSIVAFFLGDQK